MSFESLSTIVFPCSLLFCSWNCSWGKKLASFLPNYPSWYCKWNTDSLTKGAVCCVYNMVRYANHLILWMLWLCVNYNHNYNCKFNVNELYMCVAFCSLGRKSLLLVVDLVLWCWAWKFDESPKLITIISIAVGFSFYIPLHAFDFKRWLILPSGCSV